MADVKNYFFVNSIQKEVIWGEVKHYVCII